MRGRDLVEKLMQLGMEEKEIIQAFNLYTTSLILDCYLYFEMKGHKYIFGSQFFSMMNHMAGLRPTTDVAQLVWGSGRRIKKLKTPHILEAFGKSLGQPYC